MGCETIVDSFKRWLSSQANGLITYLIIFNHYLKLELVEKKENIYLKMIRKQTENNKQ